MSFPDYVSHIEQKIIHAILVKALDKKLTVSVSDGEDWPVKLSSDIEEITADIGTTDMTRLLFRKEGVAVGTMIFIHGNDEDVVHDHTDNELMEELCRQ